MAILKVAAIAAVLLGSMLTQALAQFSEPAAFQAQHPDLDVLNGGALTPEGAAARGLISRQRGYANPGGVYNSLGSLGLSECAQRYRTYEPTSGTFRGRDGRRHPCT